MATVIHLQPPMLRLVPPVDVQRAKAVMLSERQQVEQQVGLKFCVIRCPKCSFEADGCGLTKGQAEGRADRMLARHLFTEHDGQPEAV